LAQDRGVAPRLRFLLTDVLDRRKIGWVKDGKVADSRKPQANKPSCSSGNSTPAKQSSCTSGNATPTSQGNSTKGWKSSASIKGLLDVVSPHTVEGQQAGSPIETLNKKIARHGPEPSAKVEPGSKSKRSARQSMSLPEPAEAPGGSLEYILDVARLAPCPQQRGDKSGQGRGAAQSPAASPHNEAPLSKCAIQAGTISPKETLAAPATPEAAPPLAAASADAPQADNNVPKMFNVKEFHRVLSNALRDLASDRNVAAAVKRIREQRVPVSFHTAEFVDVITRAAEEKRGPARRSFFAFAAALMASEDSAFDRSRCIEGIAVFFREVYQALSLEVPRLELLVTSEFLPALMSIAPCRAQIVAAFPAEMRSHTGLWLSM